MDRKTFIQEIIKMGHSLNDLDAAKELYCQVLIDMTQILEKRNKNKQEEV